MERKHLRMHRTILTAAAAVAVAGSLLAGQAFAAEQQSSSCISCHTDAERLRAESAGIPQPKGSALQAGKG